jgi:hypothetical protein
MREFAGSPMGRTLFDDIKPTPRPQRVQIGDFQGIGALVARFFGLG